ncbi:hypothetical protein J6590_068223 [Homalodisca vitripennis]|nr:hypothetical protein J6590_068223 [Homalodisca vitripennis]
MLSVITNKKSSNGFSGNGFQCADIDECAVNNGGCSLVPRVSCINTRGSRVCGHCPPGYSGDGTICSPVEGGACAINNGGCHPSAQCFQNAGIVTCRCRDGYAGNGYGPLGCSPSTLAVNPCHNFPCKNGGTCVPAGSTFTCVCHPHLTGADCSVVVYASCDPNPCQNGGSCQVISGEGVPLMIRCTCASGFQGIKCEQQSSGTAVNSEIRCVTDMSCAISKLELEGNIAEKVKLSNYDDEELIELVSSNEILWKFSRPDYKSNIKNDVIWKKTGVSLNKSGKLFI